MKESAEQLPVKISINMKTPIGRAEHTLYRQKDVRIGNRARIFNELRQATDDLIYNKSDNSSRVR